MPKTYDLISTTTLSTATATITVTLPSTYTDIQIKGSLRSDRAALASSIYYALNTDTDSARYTRALMYDEDGAVGTEIIIASTSARQIGASLAASCPANTFTPVTFDLINYQSSLPKTSLCFVTAQRQGGPTRFIWRSTLSYNQSTPISQFSFTDTLGNFIVGSSISIYGIKKA